MSDEKSTKQEPAAGPPAAAIAELSGAPPIGPEFFLGHLAAFVRDRCPDPAEGLPVVEVHLADGETLDLCHIIGATPRWVALAVNEAERATSAPRMRTEIVPYETVLRVTIRTVRPGAAAHGFDVSHEPPRVETAMRGGMTPESALAAASVPRIPMSARARRAPRR